MHSLKFIFICFLSLVSHFSFSQYAIDSITLNTDLTKWYDEQVGLQNTVLQHGELATMTRKSHNSHAYYKHETWVDAHITYCDQTFKNVQVLYNIEEDILIIPNNLGPTFAPYPIKLRKGKVSRFEIDSSQFEYISEPVSWHKDEFYKIIYRGDSVDLLCKVFKKLEIKYGDPTYEQYHHYFLKKEGEYHRIKRVGHLVRLFPNHKKEIRRYKRKISLRNIDSPENENKFSRLVEYCDNLDKQ